LQIRSSHGLDQFCAVLEERPHLKILDLAGATQSTISFVTEQGHQICFNDFLLQLDDCFGEGDFYANQADPGRVEHFLGAAFDFPRASFDGVLVWDALEYLAPPLLATTVERLHTILRPGAGLLAMFRAEEQKEPAPSFSYRIQNRRTILLSPRGARRPAQYFSNRALEKLFQRFHSVKFFLTRDALREVIVKR
jgi:hypothetical protein